ncbi:hypothetical protein HO173_004331 [Letharia columbiana]|uniref:Arrestin-like N-terminal domain-containing protein n=1 Tax=Letharia columbiana TaxID=112416 RepID=A0A8H6FZ46_9LECA|nr:uncharacterized protein HO173_004331 [Letharia columbiana]KAF6237441.1 hypothetical protein HO173_004331 [Letharia columbiana]
MSVRIQLDKPQGAFTNLDQISGVVILSILGPETVSAITVKLEGESRSHLAGNINPRRNYDGFEKEGSRQEVHKLLYKVLTVFPTPDLLRATGPDQAYTLPSGPHAYPFRFKVPFNNDCSNNNSLLTSLNALRFEMARDTNKHVKKTLPPSLNGLPGEAEIHYYVKATVQRPAFYKENFRATYPFIFLPIEPPRPSPNKRESYARRSHQFGPSIDVPEKPGLFRKASVATTDPSVPEVPPPSISIDGRLPDPAIITCNEALPLRILITKKNETPATIYLRTLSIILVGFTVIRAHELRRQEAQSWVIMSQAHIDKALNSTVGGNGNNILEVDSNLWKQRPLPNTVSPSFATCNISRRYELEVKAGLSWGSAQNINPELTVQSVRMPVEVYSGIAPPQALLDQMADRPTAQPTSNYNLRPPGSANGPSTGHSPGPSRPHAQAHSDHIEPSPSDIPEEAPPSYEDAMADDLAPIDGPRRDYHQQTTSTPTGSNGTSGKGSASEDRLFPESRR